MPVRQDYLVRMKASSLSLKSSEVEEGWGIADVLLFCHLLGLSIIIKVTMLLKSFLWRKDNEGRKKKKKNSMKEGDLKVLWIF